VRFAVLTDFLRAGIPVTAVIKPLQPNAEYFGFA